MQDDSAGGGRDPCRDGDELAADGRGGRFRQVWGSVRLAAARVRLNAMTASTSQAALAVNTPDGRCARAESFRSAWTCSMIA